MSARRRQSERNVQLDQEFGTPHRSCLAGGDLYRQSKVSFAAIRLNIDEIERQTMNERRGEVDKRRMTTSEGDDVGVGVREGITPH
jgi:hypothetical protein